MRRRLIAGTISVYEPEEGWENTHLDVSPRLLTNWETGRQHRPDICADIAELPIADEEYDEVRCWQTLEHLRLPRARLALHEMRRVLKPEGVLDVEVPNLRRLAELFVAGKLEPWELCRNLYGDDEIQVEDPDLMLHRYGYTPETLSEELRLAGFEPGPNLDESACIRYRAVRS